MSSPRSFGFGPFLLLPERQLLLRGDTPVRIGCRALDLLTALVERPGELVTKAELIARAWPSTIVEEANLKVNMSVLRQALGECVDAPNYIATVTGRGYRFVASVQKTPWSTPAPADRRNDAAVPRHNLPIGITRIFGRDDAIESLHRDLQEARLVSIVGPGGIGKSTVAIAVATSLIATTRDGVWLVDLSTVKDPALAATSLATAIGVATDTLGEYLRDREMLILLDNCEHVIDAAATCVNRILADAAGVKILVTSREPLSVKGERVRRLANLSVPSASPALLANEALTFSAIQLFADCAAHNLESFQLTNAEAPMVAEICRKLDGIPLAIELTATRIEAFGVAGLLKQLDDRFHLCVGRRAGPERHRSLVAMLDWSYNLLRDNEAAMLRLVAVFSGAFHIDDASAVSGVTPTEASEILAQLAAKSLVATTLDHEGTAYRLFETTRAYCARKLRDVTHPPFAPKRQTSAQTSFA
jgi:predicted ATPase/DNA-binding winged helix-turn-helix (wHTH) protein